MNCLAFVRLALNVIARKFFALDSTNVKKLSLFWVCRICFQSFVKAFLIPDHAFVGMDAFFESEASSFMTGFTI